MGSVCHETNSVLLSSRDPCSIGGGVHRPKWVHLPNMNTLLNLLLLHKGLFYERPTSQKQKNATFIYRAIAMQVPATNMLLTCQIILHVSLREVCQYIYHI